MIPMHRCRFLLLLYPLFSFYKSFTSPFWVYNKGKFPLLTLIKSTHFSSPFFNNFVMKKTFVLIFFALIALCAHAQIMDIDTIFSGTTREMTVTMVQGSDVILFSTPVQFSILNMTGKEVTKPDKGTELRIGNDLPGGQIYFIRIENQGAVFVKKIK